MEQSNLFLKLRPALISLGFAFSSEHPDPGLNLKTSADPEETIIEALQFFYEDRKAFRILLRWMLEYSSLIHVERLWSLSQRADPKLLLILGAVCQKIVKQGDRRFKLIANRVLELTKFQPELSQMTLLPEGSADPYLISKYGEDEDFIDFGIIVARIDPEDKKKILPPKNVLKNNSWLKIRALIGPNFRADLVHLMAAKKVKTAGQAAKILGCSRETSYRLWREVSLFEDVEKIAS